MSVSLLEQHRIEEILGALQRNNSKKSEFTMEVGAGLTRNFFCGKSSQNSPKPVVIFLSSIPCVFCLYIHCYKLLVIMI